MRVEGEVSRCFREVIYRYSIYLILVVVVVVEVYK